MSANAAIYFEPDAYTLTGPKLMGRNAAGHGFLNGFFRHATVDQFVGSLAHADHLPIFSAMAKQAGVTRPLSMIHPHDVKGLAGIGCLFLPGPGFDTKPFMRAAYDRSAYSLCGITHTLLSDRVMDAICSMITDPVEEWDALICTSTVARDVIETVRAAECERLRTRLGAVKFPKPQLPVIPLGVDCNQFASTPASKAKARSFLNIDDDEIVVLFVGRLSFHAKAHPLPMYQALAASGAQIRLIEYGKYFNPYIRDSFDELWSEVCPRLTRTVIDGSSFENGQAAWAAADIFCSLSDNFQETFGLTPVEAMAAGLPVIISDWNGYRDTVRDRVDGFRIPTHAPSSGFGTSLSERYSRQTIDYDHYCGITSLATAIDLDETIKALRILIESPALRLKMGESGRARAHANFDWRHIIKRYQDLWNDLSQRRSHARGTEQGHESWPARLDPFHVFSTYPTHKIDASKSYLRRASVGDDTIRRLLTMKSLSLAPHLIGNETKLFRVLHQFSPIEPRSVADLDDDDGLSTKERIACVAFGLKIGALSPSQET